MGAHLHFLVSKKGIRLESVEAPPQVTTQFTPPRRSRGAQVNRLDLSAGAIRIALILRQDAQGQLHVTAEAHQGADPLTVSFLSATGMYLGGQSLQVPAGITELVLECQDGNHRPTGHSIRCSFEGLQPPRGTQLPILADPELRLRQILSSWHDYRASRLPPSQICHQLVYDSRSPLAQVVASIHSLAPLDRTVTLHGEIGSGKQLVAEAIRFFSNRRERPYVAQNCAALKATDPLLVAGELFGVGANHGLVGVPPKGRPGVFDEAKDGIVFLDEIHTLPFQAQQLLLTALDGFGYRPIPGNGETKHIHARLIVASSHDLYAEVERGVLLPEFYDRIRGAYLRVPPLRERPMDIPHLIRRAAEKRQSTARLNKSLFIAILWHPWPGNVRSLLHVLDAIYASRKEGEVDLTDLPQCHLEPQMIASLHQAYEDFQQAERRCRFTTGEATIVERIIQIAKTTLPRALPKGNDDDASVARTALADAVRDLRDCLIQVGFLEDNFKDGVFSFAELLKACSYDSTKVNSLLRHAFRALKESKVRCSCQQERPRYATFDRLFGVKYETLRRQIF